MDMKGESVDCVTNDDVVVRSLKRVLSSEIPREKIKLTDSQDRSLQARNQKIANPNEYDNTAGVIIKMKLEHFMCHNELTVGFQRDKVNFITGRNGAGKSSIMTALIVCLGGDAKSTQRAPNLGALIKAPSNKALLSVFLNNSGDCAFKHNIYGDRIEVRRTIYKTGATEYILKDINGNKVSGDRKELALMLRELNISLTNPIQILTQDNSKEYLKQSKPEQLYILFTRSTKLDELMSGMQLINAHIQKIKQNTELASSEIPPLENDINTYKSKLAKFANPEEITEKLDNIDKEIFWHHFSNNEQIITHANEKIEYYSSHKKKFLDKSDALSSELEEKLKAFELQTSSIDEQSNSRLDLLQQKSLIANEFSIANREKNDMEDANKLIQSSINSKKYELGSLFKKEKMAMEASNADSTKRQLDELEIQHKQFKAQLNTNKESNNILTEQLTQFHKDMIDFDTTIKSLSSDKENLQRNINAAKKDRDEIHRSVNNRENTWLPYASYISELVKERSASFKEMPVGPLGNYVTLSDMTYAKPVQTYLNQSMSTYTVDNDRDKSVLMQIIDDARQRYLLYLKDNNNHPQDASKSIPKPRLVVRKFAALVDISQKRVKHSSCPSVLDVIQCNNNIVLNCLIESLNIEKVLLAKTTQLAEEVARTSRNNYIKLLLNIDGDEIQPTQDGRNHFFSNQFDRFIGKFSGNHQASIQKIESHLLMLTSKMDVISGTIADIKSKQHVLIQQQEEIKYKKTNHTIQIKKLEQNIYDTCSKKNDLAYKINDSNIEAIAHQITNFKGEIEALENQLVIDSKLLPPMIQKIENLNHSLKTISSNIKKLDHMINQYNEKKSTHFKEIDRYKESIEKCKNNTVICDTYITTFTTTRSKALEQQALAEGDVIFQSSLATRVTAPRSIEVLDIERKKYMESLDGIRQNHAEKEKLADALSKLHILFQTKQSRIDQFNELIQLLESSYVLRETTNDKIMRICSRNVKSGFSALMYTRGYEYMMDISYNRQVLEIKPVVKKVVGGKAIKLERNSESIKSLSGGEKSFTMISLISSLLSVTQLPFLFFDEFDVFMDDANRDVSITTLIDLCNKNGSQTIMISPLALTNSLLKSQCEVIKLPDPIDNQSTISFKSN